MDRSGNAITSFVVHLGHYVFVVIRGVFEIFLSRRIDQIPHNESLDGLIFGHRPSRHIAAHKAHPSSIVPVLSAVLSLLWHVGQITTLFQTTILIARWLEKLTVER